MAQLYRNTDGHIYVIECGMFCKIGYSTNPRRRITQIKSILPYGIGRVWISDIIPDVMKVESKLHRYFIDKNSNGEWFRVSFNEAMSKAALETNKFKKYGNDIRKQVSTRIEQALRGDD